MLKLYIRTQDSLLVNCPDLLLFMQERNWILTQSLSRFVGDNAKLCRRQ